jgi:surface antigen
MAALAMVTGCGSQMAEAHSGWQCVTYSASHSAVALRGNAHTWWDHAEGVYARAHQPVLGAVMVMKSSGQMPMGHVAIVSRIVNDREVLLTHANWQGDGSVETNVRAVDVSPAGDWSQVRVWYAPVHALGIRSFPTYGFILPFKPGEMPTPAAATAEPTRLAMADLRP